MFGAFVHAADIDNSVTIYLCVSLLMSCNFFFFFGASVGAVWNSSGSNVMVR